MKLEADKQFRIRIRKADSFKNRAFGMKSFNLLELDDGIYATYGEQKNHQGHLKIQSLIFNSDKYTPSVAKQWYISHKESLKKAVPVQLVTSKNFVSLQESLENK